MLTEEEKQPRNLESLLDLGYKRVDTEETVNGQPVGLFERAGVRVRYEYDGVYRVTNKKGETAEVATIAEISTAFK
jgi:hypothetical protein